MNKNVIYIGVDLGDKTMSMFYVTGVSDNQTCVHLPGTIGTEPLESTVCILKNGKKILKNSIEYYQLNEIEKIYHNFKYQPDLTTMDPIKYQDMKTGVTALIDCIFESEDFMKIIQPLAQNTDEVVFCIGYPTNWSEYNLAEYKNIMSFCILGDEGSLYNYFLRSVRVYFERESTGAYVYLNDSNLKTNRFHLSTGGNILVLDFGSSTVNVTALGKDSRHALYTSGNNHLGGRQLDALIAADLISLFSAKQKNFFQELNRLNNNAAKELLIITASDIKERLSSNEKCRLDFPCMQASFRYDVKRLRKIAFSTPMNFAEDMMPGIISKYETSSWADKIKRYLHSEKENLRRNGIQPEAVILTGGGASMPLIRDICGDVFGKVNYLDASESSTVIARGLALSAKNIDKADDFIEAVEKFINESVPRKIEAEFSTLVSAISQSVTEHVCSEIKSSFISWRMGYITTFNGVIYQLRNSINMNAILQKQGVAESIQNWYQTKLYRSLNNELKEICKKFGAQTFALPTTITISMSGLALPSSNIVNQAIDASIIATVMGFIIILVGIMIFSGIGIPILAAAAGVSIPILLFKGWENFKQLIIEGLKSTDLPSFVRSWVRDEDITKAISNNKSQIESAVRNGIISNRSSLENLIKNTITEQIDSKLSEIKYELHNG